MQRFRGGTRKSTSLGQILMHGVGEDASDAGSTNTGGRLELPGVDCDRGEVCAESRATEGDDEARQHYCDQKRWSPGNREDVTH